MLITIIAFQCWSPPQRCAPASLNLSYRSADLIYLHELKLDPTKRYHSVKSPICFNKVLCRMAIRLMEIEERYFSFLFFPFCSNVKGQHVPYGFMKNSCSYPRDHHILFWMQFTWIKCKIHHIYFFIWTLVQNLIWKPLPMFPGIVWEAVAGRLLLTDQILFNLMSWKET